jgi:hypothetical protein
MSEYYLEPTDRPILYAVTGTLGGNAVAEHGQTFVGDATGVSQALSVVSGVDENEFIGAVPVDVWPVLPAAGTWLEAGEIYQWNNQAVQVRQSHTRTEHDPDTVPALFLVYRPDAGDVLDWVAGEQVYIGTHRLYDGTEYTCLQAHTTQEDWEPPDTLGVLWAVYVPPGPGIPEWVSGEQGITPGMQRTYQGNIYECRQNPGINIWPPPIVPALWLLIGPAG